MSDQIDKRIATGSENEAWEALSRMGRPLWHTSNLRKRQVLTFAANKLMLGVGPWKESHYSVHTMFGVASMLCRLGVRPCSTSALAPLIVANFMGTLAYVNYERDGFLSNYTSDPVLALGAIKVWYALENGLVKFILPQLKKLIVSEALDTGGVEEMIACIVMLLTMDKCAMNSYGRLDDELIGQLVPVKKFLALLGGGEMPVYQKGEKTPSDIGRRAFYEWVLEWQDWFVGFTHFVQLVDEPDDDTLWYLLGRRAAGVSPRGQPGAYLLIPIVKRVTKGESNEKIGNEEVSYVLVQVENWSSGDSEFSQAVTKEFSPEIVFKATGNPLSEKTVDEVIRIYMNVGEKANGSSRFIFASPLADNLPDTHSISSVTSETGSDSSDAESWCGSNAQDTGKPKRSMSGAKEKTSQVETTFLMCFRSVDYTTFPFLKEDVTASLASFVGSSWPLASLVDGDLDHRDRAGDGLSSVMPRDELHEIALRGLAKAPGRGETTVNECKKCLESSPDRKKIKRHQHR